MRASAELDVALGEYQKPLPTGFLDPRGPILNITSNQQGRIRLRDEADVEAARYWSGAVGLEALQSGDPSIYGIYDEMVQFEVKARAAFTGRMLYWKSPTVLSGSNETNWLTSRYPHILRSACLAFAADFEHDDAGYAREIQRCSALIASAMEKDELSRRGEDTTWDSEDDF
jgi:hypothetical protein